MRISERFYLDALQQGLTQAGQRMQRVSMQITSGRRLQVASEDPVGAGLVLRARAQVAQMRDQQQTVQRGLDHARAGDQALGEIGSAVQRAQNLLLRGLDETVQAPGAREGLASELEGLLAHLVDQANRAVTGRHLFGGTRDQTAPVVRTAEGEYRYAGNDEHQQFPVAPGRSSPANLPGSLLFNFANAAGQRAVPQVDTDLFSLVQGAVEQLREGDRDGLRDSAEQLAQLQRRVTEQRGVLGGYAVRLQAAQETATRGEITARMVLADTESVNVPQAVMEMKALELTYQAALVAVGKVASLPSVLQQWR